MGKRPTLGHNGGPTYESRADMPPEVTKPFYFKCYARDFLDDILRIPLDERGFYVTAIMVMYQNLEGLPADDKMAAMSLAIDVRQYRHIKRKMIERGLLYERPSGRVSNRRFEAEITAYVAEFMRRRESAVERERRKAEEAAKAAAAKAAAAEAARLEAARVAAARLNSPHRDRVEIAARSPRDRREIAPISTRNLADTPAGLRGDNSEKCNGINEASCTTGAQGEQKVAVRARDLELELELESKRRLPPTPHAGGDREAPIETEAGAPFPDPTLDPDEPKTEPSRGAKAAETRKRNEASRADVLRAHELYNRAAAHWGFASCDVLTEARTKRLARRLADIGGVDNFRRALRAIGGDDFLMGRVPPRDGQAPFRLNFDRLLQTDGGLGDVLARLIESGGGGSVDDPPPGPNGAPWGWWRGHAGVQAWSAEMWRRRIVELQLNGEWPWWFLGPAPGHPECVIPAEVVTGLGLDAKYGGQTPAGRHQI